MPYTLPIAPTRHFAFRPRRGGVYVAVLGVAMILTLIAMASLHLSRVEIDVLSGAQQVSHAELLSQSAAELAIARVMADSSWRTNYSSGAEVPSANGTSLGTGNIKFALIDADGDLNDDDRDPITIRGVGRSGEATQVTTVLLQPTNDSLESIDVAFHCGGNLTSTGQVITCDQTISSNGHITGGGGGHIHANAWATGNISGSVSGAKFESQSPARAMPETTAVWDYYLANGTSIDIASIPNQTIDNVVLSAASNPYGATNPQGIYIIDTQGQALHIRDSRIVATLVVLSPAAATKVESLIEWSPPAANYPALLVKGDLELKWSGGSPLVESTANVNFNPAGTPFEGDADQDQLDSYPGMVKGLVYCSGNLTTTNPCVMHGSLVAGGAATIGASVTIAYGGAPAAFPPPGFAHGSVMRVVPRSWRRTAR